MKQVKDDKRNRKALKALRRNLKDIYQNVNIHIELYKYFPFNEGSNYALFLEMQNYKLEEVLKNIIEENEKIIDIIGKENIIKENYQGGF